MKWNKTEDEKPPHHDGVYILGFWTELPEIATWREDRGLWEADNYPYSRVDDPHTWSFIEFPTWL